MSVELQAAIGVRQMIDLLMRMLVPERQLLYRGIRQALFSYFISRVSGGLVRHGRLCPTELVLLFEVGTGPGRLMMGLEEWGGPIFAASLPT
jgi:hypothetical protein